MIGLLGDIRFRVSDRKVITMNRLKREMGATWNTMDRIGQKPLVEYGGPNLQTLSMEIVLDASLGIKPRNMLRTLERMAEGREAYEMVLGRKLVGKNKWVVYSRTESSGIHIRLGARDGTIYDSYRRRRKRAAPNFNNVVFHSCGEPAGRSGFWNRVGMSGQSARIG